MSIVDRHHEFIGALRSAGLPVSVDEDIVAATALGAVDLLDREQVRTAYAATLIKKHTDRPAFDTLFDIYFPAVLGNADAPSSAESDRATAPFRRDDPELLAFRAALSDALRDGDEQLMVQLAREGVGRFGAVAGRLPGTQSWSSYSAQTRISPQTLMAGLLEQVLAGSLTDDPLAERNARTMLTARIDRFRSMLDTEVQRRLAAESGRERIAKSAVRPSVERLDLLSATRTDLAAIRREIQPLARRLAARLAIEQRHRRRGQLDFRHTIRASLSSGGIPIETRHRPRRPRKTDLVVLCDVSESVTSFAHFTLLLVYALREQFTRVRVFAFVDDLDEVTDFFRPGADLVESVERLAAEANVRGWYGRTDYGRAFEIFHERHLDAISARTSLLVLGDARSNYGDPALPVLRDIVKRARRAYWLNPERRSAWDTGDSVADDFGGIMPMVECRNLAQLAGFVRDLV